MITKSMSVDLKLHGILVVALHPGWTLTKMGGPNAKITTTTSVAGLLKVMGGLNEASAGSLIKYDGEIVPWSWRGEHLPWQSTYISSSQPLAGARKLHWNLKIAQESIQCWCLSVVTTCRICWWGYDLFYFDIIQEWKYIFSDLSSVCATYDHIINICTKLFLCENSSSTGVNGRNIIMILESAIIQCRIMSKKTEHSL